MKKITTLLTLLALAGSVLTFAAAEKSVLQQGQNGQNLYQKRLATHGDETESRFGQGMMNVDKQHMEAQDQSSDAMQYAEQHGALMDQNGERIGQSPSEEQWSPEQMQEYKNKIQQHQNQTPSDYKQFEQSFDDNQ